MWDYDRLFEIIEELIMHHSPSGAGAEINQLLMQRFTALGLVVLTPETSQNRIIIEFTTNWSGIGCQRQPIPLPNNDNHC